MRLRRGLPESGFPRNRLNTKDRKVCGAELAPNKGSYYRKDDLELLMFSKNKIRAFVAVVAIAAAASAQAGFVYTDAGGTGPIIAPLNNDFRSQLGSFELGRTLGLTGAQAGDVIDIDFFAAEAGYRNTFSWGNTVLLNNQGNKAFGETDVATVGAYNGALGFKFCAVTVNSCLTNSQNNTKGWNSYQSIGMWLTDGGSTAWLLWDDSGANMDDDHDDLVIRLRHRRVPEPGTLALFGAGLIGLAVFRRRRNSMI